jgi:hypothetical protein
MGGVLEWLKGKKAFLSAAVAAITLLVGFIVVGDFSAEAIRNFVTGEAFAATLAAIRAAFGRTEQKVAKIASKIDKVA